jgi:hypothetical protein
MFQKLRQALIAITTRASEHELDKDVRQLMVQTAKDARGPEGLMGSLDRIGRLEYFKNQETNTWVEPDVLIAQGGRFDTCNLMHWVELAKASGTPYITAIPILTLTEEEIQAISPKIRLPDNSVTRFLKREATKLLNDNPAMVQDSEPEADTEAKQEIIEKLFQALDDIPEGYMVRHARCGPSVLKTLAGAGVAGGKSPEVAFGPDLMVGPGWVRNGNRRRVDVLDSRTMKVGIGAGPDAPHTWLARPWVNSARWTHGDDPHRHGTAFQGPGFWPAEWRVFVENGKVTGVSYYYPWAGMATSEDAENALKVRDVAQKMVDYAIGLNAIPVFLDVEFARENSQFTSMGFDKKLPRDGFACCLDFIETPGPDGIEFTFLEGGPPFSPFGGAHPCGFLPLVAKTHTIEGVALKLPDGVNMMEPTTWNVPLEGAIFTWDEVEELANTHSFKM